MEGEGWEEGVRRVLWNVRECVDVFRMVPGLRNEDNNNRYNDWVERHNLRFVTISSLCCELSPTRMLKCQVRSHVQIPCNTLGAHHTQHVERHVVQKHSSTFKFDRVEIAFILGLFYCLKQDVHYQCTPDKDIVNRNQQCFLCQGSCFPPSRAISSITFHLFAMHRHEFLAVWSHVWYAKLLMCASLTSSNLV